MPAWLVTIVFPLLIKYGGAFLQRAWTSWRTTATGAGVGAVTYGAVNQFLAAAGCAPDTIDLAAGVAAVGPLVQGLFSIDRKVANGQTITTRVVAEQVDKDGKPIPRS